MNVGMYRGMEAMAASEQRLASVTTNLANARSTAFKRVATVQHGEATPGGNPEHAVVRTRTSIDWTQGPLERTGVATDLALQGEGFFVVEGPKGELFTRDGRFQVTEEGALVTGDGLPVAWAGARGTLDPVGSPLRIDLDGSVHQGDQRVGRLQLVDFAERGRLEQGRLGYFVAPPELERLPAASEVHQYALEGSNVSSVDELVRLISTQRSFEAGSNVVQMIGQTYERLARAGR